jgi:hypothetical protein
LALIAAFQGTLDEHDGGPGELHASVWSPSGRVWRATNCHLVAIGYRTDRTAGWRALVADLEKGLDLCTDPKCDVCPEAISSTEGDTRATLIDPEQF